MKLVRQPPKTTLCGQACVATIVGISLEDSVHLVGTAGKTHTKHLRDALAKKGFVPYRGATRYCKRCQWTARMWSSATLIVKFKLGKANHWVVRHKGKYYDPAAGVFRYVPKYLAQAKPTSFLVVSKEVVQ